MTPQELSSYLSTLTGQLNREEGVQYGPGDTKIHRLHVSWMPTVDSIRHAVASQANCMLIHESLWQPYPGIRGEPPADYLSWPPNRLRQELLDKGRITVFRLHSTLDRYCIFAEFARALHLTSPAICDDAGVRIYDVEPTPLCQIARQVKYALRLDSLRVACGDLDRTVRRIALAPGGCALFVNVSFQAQLMRHDPDLIIAGETDTYGMHFALDAGVAMIETGHEVSETPGIRHFVEKLKNDLPEVLISYYENRRPWVVL